jgi:signal transduction histidine kinase
VSDIGSAPAAQPRIRRRLRLIAVGLVLLPSLALLLLLRAMAQVEGEATLREGEERLARLQSRADALAQALVGRLPAEPREQFTLLEGAPPGELSRPVEIDGSCEDWRVDGLVDPEPCESAGVAFDRVEWLAKHREEYDPQDFSFRIRTAMRDDHLHVFVRVVDDEVIMRQRDLHKSDQLRIVAALPTDEGDALPVRFVTTLEAGAEGRVSTRQVGRSWRREVPERSRLPWGERQNAAPRRPAGAWRATGDGYSVELRLPLRTLGAGWRDAQLGLAVVDVDRRGASRQTAWVAPQREGALAWRSPGAAIFRKSGPDLDLGEREIAVLDARGRELFSTFEPEDDLRESAAALLFGTTDEGLAPGGLVAAPVPDARGDASGWVVERDPRPSAGRRLAAVVRGSTLTAATLALALLLLFILLAYTRRLSRRILALVEHVGGERHADDEIGELSRRLSDLMERDRAHRGYLEQLPRILGHETLGPLGVVKMFIDDLDAPDPGSAEGRRQRARRAIHSIEGLIEDLREATSLEEALEQGERVELDLVELLRDSVMLSRDVHPGPVQVDLPEEPVRIVVIERRIEQLLDKLLDNAADFSDGTPVRVTLACADGVARLRVENRGSKLPEGAAGEQLFSPMWSGRKRTAERHLGLGLYIARVIAEAHGGSIRAWNEGDDRVVFEVTLPT